jgi:hypothetical protein
MHRDIPGATLTYLAPAKDMGSIEHHARFAEIVRTFSSLCLLPLRLAACMRFSRMALTDDLISISPSNLPSAYRMVVTLTSPEKHPMKNTRQIVLITAAFVPMLALTVGRAVDITPVETRAIAEEGFIFGLPIVMNYAVMYEYAVDSGSGQF